MMKNDEEIVSEIRLKGASDNHSCRKSEEVESAAFIE